MSLISRGKEYFFFNDDFTEIITKREESLIFFFHEKQPRHAVHLLLDKNRGTLTSVVF